MLKEGSNIPYALVLPSQGLHFQSPLSDTRPIYPWSVNFRPALPSFHLCQSFLLFPPSSQSAFHHHRKVSSAMSFNLFSVPFGTFPSPRTSGLHSVCLFYLSSTLHIQSFPLGLLKVPRSHFIPSSFSPSTLLARSTSFSPTRTWRLTWQSLAASLPFLS